jgi:UDP-glucose-4-epimerase GalE
MSTDAQSPAVLVAGGAGYIGSHTAKVLLQAGYEPIVLDNLCTGFRSNVQFGPFYEGSIGNAALVREAIQRHNPIGAILFAGHAYVGESTTNPRKYFNNNIIEAISFLNHLLDSGGPRPVVFSSSCSVYGIQAKVPIAENSSQDPLSPYAESKAIFEKVLKWYGSAYGLKYASLRYFNAAGADPEGQLGEDHDPETHLIPLAIDAALGKAPLKVFGTDYPTPDGTAIRDYIHVTDLGDAHVRALRRLTDGGDSLTLNLGTGCGNSVLEVIRQVERTSGVPVPVQYTARRDGDAPALVADPTRARELLGWTPKYSSLETIVETAWSWRSRMKTSGG